MNVICISGKAQHGKDTTASIMKEQLESINKKVLIAHFGDLVKYVCTNFFNWDGKKDENGRTLLQYVGTDIVRKQRPAFWTEFIVNILNLFKNEWEYVLIPDCRFPNEVECFFNESFSTKLIRINRVGFKSPLTIEQQHHPSETAMDEYQADYYIENNGTFDDLKEKINVIIMNMECHNEKIDNIV